MDGDAARAVKKAHDLPTVEAFQLDATDQAALRQHIQAHPSDAVVSGLPYFCNEGVAEVAAEMKLHYFDLTEDVAATRAVRRLAAGAQEAAT